MAYKNESLGNIVRVVVTTKPISDCQVTKILCGECGESVLVLNSDALEVVFGPLAHRVLVHGLSSGDGCDGGDGGGGVADGDGGGGGGGGASGGTGLGSVPA